MKNGMIIEIAIVNTFRDADSYWRLRWIADGEQIDAITQIDDLAGMRREAVRHTREMGEPVAWRYYATGLEYLPGDKRA